MLKRTVYCLLKNKVMELNQNGFSFVLDPPMIKEGNLILGVKGKKSEKFTVVVENDGIFLLKGAERFPRPVDDLVLEMLIEANGGPERELRPENWANDLFGHISIIAS